MASLSTINLLYSLVHLSVFVTICATKDPAITPLLLISFDGFRWDYFHKAPTPNFDRLMREGARAKWIKNTYVTKTLPNHFTIVTGLYQESHGLVANSFYDPKFDAEFSFGTPRDSRMFDEFGAEPIWVTAKLQRNASVGCFFWIGCEAEIGGVRPDITREFDWGTSSAERLETGVRWLVEGEGAVPAVDVALVYLNQPDFIGHEHGPGSPEVAAMIGDIDELLGDVIRRLEAGGLWGAVNVILTSDHGMARLDCGRDGTIINLSRYGVDTGDYTFLSSAPVHHVWNKTEGGIERLLEALRDVDHMHLYTPSSLPPEYHYSRNRRIPPLLIETEPGYVIVLENDTECGTGVRGYHGFNNSLPDMHPFFIGVGPGFARNAVVDHFDIVDIYPLMCNLLSLRSAPNNGSLHTVNTLLRMAGGANRVFYMADLFFLHIVAISIQYTIIPLWN